jgi:uncharacterized ion transporter superfamily protein YfcC
MIEMSSLQTFLSVIWRSLINAIPVALGGLAIARVGYGTWWKFVWPVLILLMVLSILVLAVGTLV